MGRNSNLNCDVTNRVPCYRVIFLLLVEGRALSDLVSQSPAFLDQKWLGKTDLYFYLVKNRHESDCLLAVLLHSSGNIPETKLLGVTKQRTSAAPFLLSCAPKHSATCEFFRSLSTGLCPV